MPKAPVAAGADPVASAAARATWSSMSELVLHNVRRREVSEALGMSFGRIRAIRRLAHQPMAMSELASALGIDAPYATVVVDDLESRAWCVGDLTRAIDAPEWWRRLAKARRWRAAPTPSSGPRHLPSVP